MNRPSYWNELTGEREEYTNYQPFTDEANGEDHIGEHLLDKIHAFLKRFIAYPSKEASIAHALWVAHTHMMEAFEATPRIAFLSPEKASGKTRALEVTANLVPNPVELINVTPAYLIRKIGNQAERPTLLYDEIDTVFGLKAKKDNEDVRAILNAGHRKGATSGRCAVLGHTVRTEEIPVSNPPRAKQTWGETAEEVVKTSCESTATGRPQPPQYAPQETAMMRSSNYIYALARSVAGLLMLSSATFVAKACAEDVMASGAADRAYLVHVMTRIARPVLDATSKGKLHRTLPIHEWERARSPWTHYEAFARTLAGIAPWLELGPDDTTEGQQRAQYITMARQALINATDPLSPDYMNFGQVPDQPLVNQHILRPHCSPRPPSYGNHSTRPSARTLLLR